MKNPLARKAPAPAAEQPMPLADAINELQRGLRVFKAFEHAEALCVRLQGAEQHERELKASVDSLTAERDALTADVLKLKQAGKEAKAHAEKLIPEAKASADSILATGQLGADNLIAAGQVKADQLVADAEAAAALLAEAGEAQAQRNMDLLTEAEALEKRVADAKAYLANLTAGA